MKIVALTAENVKKLVAVEIRPDGNLVQITGKNGQGKTSVLDAIWWALAGAGTIQKTPVRHGQKKARIRLDMGDIIVTRTFTAKDDGEFTTAIAVENADGAKFSSPQKMLDDMLGELTFDPLAFSRMKPREQFDTLCTFVPGIDFGALEAAHAADYAERRDINRRAAEKRAQAGPSMAPAGADTEDEASLVAELEAAGHKNTQIEQRRARRSQMAKDAAALREVAKIARGEAVRLVEKADADDQAAAEIETKLSEAGPLPEIIDTKALLERIAKAREGAAHIAKTKERKALLSEAAALEAQSDALTSRMAERENSKQATIAAATLPVAGIGFGDGFVTLNGVPFDQASDAEQLRASIAIAMAANPTLRVVRVRDGSLLDEDAMKMLESMANEKDYQVWIERVDGSGKIGFVLEDGYLKGADA